MVGEGENSTDLSEATTLSPNRAMVDFNKPEDVITGVTLGKDADGNAVTLSAVKFNGTALTVSEDYTFDEGTLTIKSKALSGLTEGVEAIVTVELSDGTSATLTLTVVNNS